MDSVEQLLGARRRVIAAHGHEFEVFEAGEGGKLALLLHGFPQHAVSWRHQVPYLAGLGYRVWAVNQRGYGGTSRPRRREDYALDRLTEDVAGLIDAAGAFSVTLIGHDWGAFVAWIFAIRRIRLLERLVIINVPHPLCFRRELKTWAQRRKSWYIGFFQLPVLPELLLAAGEGRLLAATMRHDARNPEAFSNEVLDVYRTNVSAPGAATAMLNWYRAAGRDVMAATDLDALIETPTLVIWGEEDVALGLPCLDGTDLYVRDLRIERLPNVSHWAQEDAPQEVNRVLEEFL
ncbi:alpha/beta fold hydrolase [Methylocapsa sp. D3K7]|uniref:alpha/beta fold hydrolase n=1 Tax=Methylocapsa sp. D3K7 TaxID=3041435 RepID=UPI00244EEFF4|nr:alpha/beta fold hydrolase [Methylocapsa sp. D3K7]WGJ12979.1 alpha/beta fold hydrolase [Methylocapsa sp. D3K7]